MMRFLIGQDYQRIGFLILTFMIFNSCKTKEVKETPVKENETVSGISKAGPPAIIYKTKSDFFNLVPVLLSEDGSKIESYPDIRDIYYKGEFAYPTRLANDYLLDNRGIGKNVAFLKYSYEEYGNLDKTPSSDELYLQIIDKDPLSEMYHCGSRFDYRDIEAELNGIINSGRLNTLKRIK
jgi:hypothetical protein